MTYPALTLAPHQTFERQIALYAGPKEYQTLARIGNQFNNNLDLVMSFGWAGFVSKALLLGMNWLHSVMKISYGWAIIAITVIIKARLLAADPGEHALDEAAAGPAAPDERHQGEIQG